VSGATLSNSKNPPLRINAGVAIDDSSIISPPTQATGWLRAWEKVGGGVTISGDGRHLQPWIEFTSDRHAPGIVAHLMRELLDTPGLPRAIRAIISERYR